MAYKIKLGKVKIRVDTKEELKDALDTLEYFYLRNRTTPTTKQRDRTPPEKITIKIAKIFREWQAGEKKLYQYVLKHKLRGLNTYWGYFARRGYDVEKMKKIDAKRNKTRR